MVTTDNDFSLYAHWTKHPTSDWVRESEAPEGAEITEQKWSYTQRNYTESGSASLDGWTKYDTKRTSWGNWSGWSTSNPSNGSRNVESRSVFDHTEYHYYRWVSYSLKGVYSYNNGSSYVLEEKWFTYILPKTSQYDALGYVGSDTVMNWWVRADYEGNRSVSKTFTRNVNRTEYRYQDPVYTYYYYQDVNLESGSDPSSLANVSNIQKWVKYIAK